MAKHEAIHYLRRAISISSDNGYTEYMVTCFVHCFYHGTLLQ